MSQHFISNLQHFLNEQGVIPNDLPAEVKSMAEYLTGIVSAVTFVGKEHDFSTGVPCLSTLNGAICSGLVGAALLLDDQVDINQLLITWICPECGSHGEISGWEGSFWDHWGDEDPLSESEQGDSMIGKGLPL